MIMASDNESHTHLKRPLYASRSSSARSKYPPQSSSSSVVTMSSRCRNRSGSDAGLVSGINETSGSDLLRERIQQQRTIIDSQSACSEDGRLIQSSPARKPSFNRLHSAQDHSRTSNSTTNYTMGGAGVRESEDKIAKLTNQIWNLKVTVSLHQEKEQKLEDSLARAEAKVFAYDNLLQKHKQLEVRVADLENALDEAAAQLARKEADTENYFEERIDLYGLRDGLSSSAKTNLQHFEIASSPPTTRGVYIDDANLERLSSDTSSSQSREYPQFDTTHTLFTKSQNFDSFPDLPNLIQDDEPSSDDDRVGMRSPCLSNLSQSSFPSLYGEKHAIDLSVLGHRPQTPPRSSQNSRPIEDEVPHNAGDVVMTPDEEIPRRTGSLSATPLRSSRSRQFQSLNDVLESPFQAVKLSDSEQRRKVLTSTSSQRTVRRLKRKITPSSTEHPFSTHVLPPTPDTISTSTIDMDSEQNSGDDHKMQVSAKTTDATDLRLLRRKTRHGSIGETITSRREGHGLDTETEVTIAETAPLMTEESFDPWLTVANESRSRDAAGLLAASKKKRLEPPNLLSFSTMGGDEEDVSHKFMSQWHSRPTSNPACTSELSSPKSESFPQLHTRLNSGVPHDADSPSIRPARYSTMRSITTPTTRELQIQPTLRRSSLANHLTLNKERRQSAMSSESSIHPAFRGGSGLSRQSALTRITSKLFNRSEADGQTARRTSVSMMSQYRPNEMGRASISQPSLLGSSNAALQMYSSRGEAHRTYHDMFIDGLPHSSSQDLGARCTSGNASEIATNMPKTSFDNMSLDSVAPPPIPRWHTTKMPGSIKSNSSPFRSVSSRDRTRSIDRHDSPRQGSVQLNHKPKFGVLVGVRKDISGNGPDVPVYGHGGDILIDEGDERDGHRMRNANRSRSNSVLAERKWFGFGAKRGSVIGV